MAHLIPSNFSFYALTDQEAREGTLLTITQKQVIQNLIATLATELNTLEPDPNDYAKFIQQQAHSKGELDSLIHLIASSEAVEHEIAQEADLRPEIIEDTPAYVGSPFADETGTDTHDYANHNPT